jgi:hypothetical protein
VIFDCRDGAEDVDGFGSCLTSGCSSFGFFRDAAAVVDVLLLLLLAAEPRGLRVLTSLTSFLSFSGSFSLRVRVRLGLTGCGSPVWLVGDRVARERRVLVTVGLASPCCRPSPAASSSPVAAVEVVVLARFFFLPLVAVVVVASVETTVEGRDGESDRDGTPSSPSSPPSPSPNPAVTPSDSDMSGGDDRPGDELIALRRLSCTSSSSFDIPIPRVTVFQRLTICQNRNTGLS